MAGDVYKIQDEKIKPDALYNAVLADSDGAVTTFAGVVRDNTITPVTKNCAIKMFQPRSMLAGK